MMLCNWNPQLLKYDWAVELVQRVGGKVDNNENTALILLFWKNPEKTDFNSKGFKLLWEKEKGISITKLKEQMRKKPELNERVVAAIPDAVAYYE